MKKISIFVLSFATLVLFSGCQQSEIIEDTITTNSESAISPKQDVLADFEEEATIKETIDISTLQMELETDNANKRVLFFSTDKGQKRYKSIFIKRTERLKIIDLSDDNILYNQEIH